MEAVSAPGGGRGGGGIAVFLVAAVGVRGARRAAGVVVEEQIGSAAVGAASPTTAPTPTPDVTLGLQQELPVHGLQLQIVHAEHGASRLGRHFTARYNLRRGSNM